MNSKQIGNITEFEVMLVFVKLGYCVLTPYGDCERYDFVVDYNGRFIRFQCKTARSRDNGSTFSFDCRSSHRKDGKIVHHKYTNTEIDYFATCFNGQCYLIPVGECSDTKILRLLPPRNNQVKDIAWAKDYELEKVIKEW